MSARPVSRFPEGEAAMPLPEPQKPVQRAVVWLRDAMAVVTEVFPHVLWLREVDPALSDEFDAALEGRFWLGTLSEGEFKAVWRRWYSAHL